MDVAYGAGMEEIIYTHVKQRSMIDKRKLDGEVDESFAEQKI